MFGTHLWEHRWKGLGFQVCGFGVLGTVLWGMRVVDMGRTYPVMGNQPGNALGSCLWEHMQVAFYGTSLSILKCLSAQRFSSGSRLWVVSKVTFYGSVLGPIGRVSSGRVVSCSHRQVRCHGQVTFYGETGWLPFMGESRREEWHTTKPMLADRYLSMGFEMGSKLWEKNGAVLQGTTNPADDPDFARLLPMDGYLPEGKSRAGFRFREMKGSGLWETFRSKGRWIWGSLQID